MCSLEAQQVRSFELVYVPQLAESFTQTSGIEFTLLHARHTFQLIIITLVVQSCERDISILFKIRPFATSALCFAPAGSTISCQVRIHSGLHATFQRAEYRGEGGRCLNSTLATTTTFGPSLLPITSFNLPSISQLSSSRSA